VGEAAMLGTAGALVGLPAGRALAELALGPLLGILSDVFMVLEARGVEWTATPLVQAAAAGVVTAVLAALVPAARAAEESPADTIRHLPPIPRLGHRLIHLAACLALLGVGGASIAFRDRLPERTGTYGGLMLVLVGLLLTTPLLADALARVFRPAVQFLFGVEERLAADNLVRSRSRTGLVITALAAGVALVLQTAGMIRSNQTPILGWVDDTFLADLFVTSGSPLSGSGQDQSIRDDVGHHLAALPGVEAALPLRLRTVDYGDSLVFLSALDAPRFYTHDRQRGMSGEGVNLLPRLAEPGLPNVLASENFVALHRVQVGDVIEVRGPQGPVPVRVIGTVVDYSWNRGALIMDLGRYRERFADPFVDLIDVYLKPGTDPEAVQEVIQRASWGVDNALVALKRDELRGRIDGMIRRLYSVAYAQEAVVGVVAALGVVTALLISVLQRRRELGLLRAVGATRGQVLRTVLAEAALMGVIGTLIGLALGIALEWYCVRVILFDESGFLFPVVIPWEEAALLAGVAVLIATLAGLGPALHTSRLRIPEAIAYE
jgi:putative ABC transport system permease protein